MGTQTTVTIKTELGPVEARKMVLGDYAELLRGLNKLPEQVSKLVGEDKAEKGIDRQQLLTLLPTLAAESLPELASVLAIPTDKDGDFIMKLDLPDILELIDGILDVNDFERIQGAIKKLTARASNKKLAHDQKS